MGMLDRYRKPGGFVQLLTLIETSSLQKREKFLEIVREEDPAWADALNDKLLSIQRILTWDQETLMEITASLQPLNLAVLLHGLEENPRAKIKSAMSASQTRMVMEHFNTAQPNPAEISTIFARVITEVRKMITEGQLRLEKIDPTAEVDDGIEDALKKPVKTSMSVKDPTPQESWSKIEYEPGTAPEQAAEGSTNTVAMNGAEVAVFKKKLQVLMQENQSLKHEVLRLRSKLEQIKKIA